MALVLPALGQDEAVTANAPTATVLAGWGFEGVTTTNTGTTPTVSVGSATADTGAQTAGSSFTALHASSSTVWSNPAGNGSAKSLSSNNWGVGDYIQFLFNTTGYNGISITWDQTGSSTGPKDFKVQYSTNGTTFTDASGTNSTYAVLLNGSPNVAWTSATYNPAFTLTLDLSSVTALNNQATVYIRLVNTSTTSTGGGTVATAGTERVDNFSVSAGGTGATHVQHVADFNGDGLTDYGVVRGGPGGNSGQATWFVKLNGSSAEIQKAWGFNSDILVPADYDGDGKTDIAVWRQTPGTPTFYILRSSDSTFQITPFGNSGDLPNVADYTGDGKADPAVFHASGTQGSFWYYPSNGPFVGHPVGVNWGSSTDIPTPGDFNGDGKADFCFVHPGGGVLNFNIKYGTDTIFPGPPDTFTFFGLPTDSVISGDFDGDGKSDIAVTRVQSGAIAWYFLPSSGGSFQGVVWGLASTDLQVPGDYDGDGKTDVAIWRQSATPGATAFYVLGSKSGFLFQQYGISSTDTPVNFDVLQ